MEPAITQANRGPRPARRSVVPRRVSGPASGRRLSPDELVISLVRDHSSIMLGIARRFSICADDAHDAWQRSVEILIRRAPTLDPATAAAWLKTVVRHEAMAVRADRMRALELDGNEPDSIPASIDLEANSERFERMTTAAEALERLKPHEAEALLLFASGLSYREISDAKGWSYTKVNRLITEGRKSFRARVSGIESGEECARWSPILDRLVGGQAEPDEVKALRPHLRRCPACRAEVRNDRNSFAGLALLMPAAMIPGPSAPVAPREWLAGVRTWLGDTALALGIRVQSATEAVTASKAMAVAASAAAIASGGVAARNEVIHSGPASSKAIAHAAPVSSRSAGAVTGTESTVGVSDPDPAPRSAGDSGSQKVPSALSEEPAASEFDPMSEGSVQSAGTGQVARRSQDPQSSGTESVAPDGARAGGGGTGGQGPPRASPPVNPANGNGPEFGP